jgi:hypothetical protein
MHFYIWLNRMAPLKSYNLLRDNTLKGFSPQLSID